MRTKYHVVPRSRGRWGVIKEGNERASLVFENKAQAIKYARKLIKNTKLGQILIHGRDGKIQKEYTYGQDPRKYPS